MNIYKQLLEEAGIFDHGIPDNPPSPIVSFGETEWWEPELYQMDYQQEQEFQLNIKKIHRYVRLERFKFTVHQLLGQAGYVPYEAIKVVKRCLGGKVSKKRIWNKVRKILKVHKGRKFYNRIPNIVGRITGLWPHCPTGVVDTLVKDFMGMSCKFDSGLGVKWGRRYFLNMRFVALMLMEKHGVVFPYHIPLVRTIRKRKYLLDLYNQF